MCIIINDSATIMGRQVIVNCKRELIEIYKYALEAIKPDRLIKNALNFSQGNLIVRDVLSTESAPLVYPLTQRGVHVIGGGKCVLAMARGLAELANRNQIQDVFGHGCISVPAFSRQTYKADSSLRTLLESIQIDCRFGATNNLPDEDSVAATESMLQCVRDASRRDESNGLRSLFIVLISGGGSACLSAPKHIRLEEKARIIKELVQRGADIVELNKVRRCFSRVKAGNLARHIKKCSPNSQIISLIMSDVIGDPIEFIASGPTFIGESKESQESSAEIMRKYSIDHLMPAVHMDGESFNAVGGQDVINRLIGTNEIAIRAAGEKASDLGYQVKILGNNLSGRTSDILDRLIEGRDGSKVGKLLLIAGGEGTVEKLADESWGTGGRTQEMALDYMISKLSSRERNDDSLVDTLLAGTTDGQDGPTDVSGCMASYAEWSIDPSFDVDSVRAAKREHDSFNFWNDRKPEWLLKFGPTGTNVMDLYFLMLVEKPPTD